jgi:hypothetical protein
MAHELVRRNSRLPRSRSAGLRPGSCLWRKSALVLRPGCKRIVLVLVLVLVVGFAFSFEDLPSLGFGKAGEDEDDDDDDDTKAKCPHHADA